MKIIDFTKGFLKNPLAHWPFVNLSRAFYGNTAGAKQNLYGRAQLQYFRLLGKKDRSGSNARQMRKVTEAVQRIHHTGLYLIDKPVIATTNVIRIREKIELAFRDRISEGGYIATVDSNELTERVPEVMEFVRSNLICNIIQDFFKSAFHIDQIVYRMTTYVPDEILQDKEIYSNFWHCDSSPTSELALFVNLVDVDENTGPTNAISKVKTKLLVRKHFSERNSFDPFAAYVDDERDVTRFIGPAGSVLFAQTTRCLHRASIPDPGKVRHWLSIRLYPKNAPMVTDRVYKDPVLRYTHGRH
tara:strand:- start:259913 stop:260815 length:903 start_codon:yes stop_codon:yes gene_type:complete